LAQVVFTSQLATRNTQRFTPPVLKSGGGFRAALIKGEILDNKYKDTKILRQILESIREISQKLAFL
jgi:hypothetical protein